MRTLRSYLRIMLKVEYQKQAKQEEVLFREGVLRIVRISRFNR